MKNKSICQNWEIICIILVIFIFYPVSNSVSQQIEQREWRLCAEEGQSCSFSGKKEVIYGANGKYTQPRIIYRSTPCNNNVFGDPVPGIKKECLCREINESHHSLDQQWRSCAREGQVCSFSGTKEVIYGANGKYTRPRVIYRSTPCDNSVFGDPIPDVEKECLCREIEGSHNFSNKESYRSSDNKWSLCAEEGENCSFYGTKEVIYGIKGRYTSPRIITNGTPCNNRLFGDPAPGNKKECLCRDVSGSGHSRDNDYR